MSTSKETLSLWFDQGVRNGFTHMIVFCDTFDWEDYPVYTTSATEARAEVANTHGADMTKVMEVYNLQKDKAAQMAEHRAFNYE
jgi:hypothetical protein